ncbi:MAG: DNA polymerase [Reichenbachiella sp.]
MAKAWLQALSIELKIANIIHEQAQTGWLFNKSKCVSYIEELTSTMDNIYSELKTSLPLSVKQYGVTVLEPFKLDGKPKKMATDWIEEELISGPFTRIYFEDMNLGSDKQVKAFLLALGWEPTWWNFRKKDSKEGKKGDRMSPKLSDQGTLCPNLDNLDGKLGKSIGVYLKCKHRRSLLEGLLKVLRPDGRIPAEANTIGAATHRMTHRKIVNIPGSNAFFGTEIRSLFISREGYSIVGCDSKSNQARMLCHYMKDDKYTDAVVNGDIHSTNQEAAKLDTRANAKTFFYGFIFGAGDTKIGKIVGGSMKAGKALKAQFLRSLPKLALLLKQVKKAVRVRGYLYGLDGRKIYCSSEHKALNYLLQSAEAIYMKYSQAFLYKAIVREGLDATFVATVHDEYSLEVRDDHVDRVKELTLWAMEHTGEYLKLSVPMEGDSKIGQNWMEVH